MLTEDRLRQYQVAHARQVRANKELVSEIKKLKQENARLTSELAEAKKEAPKKQTRRRRKKPNPEQEAQAQEAETTTTTEYNEPNTN